MKETMTILHFETTPSRTITYIHPYICRIRICNYIINAIQGLLIIFKDITSLFHLVLLTQVFGPKRDENGDWRKLHNEELHNLCCSRDIFRVIKSTRLSWADHVARMEEGRSAFKRLTVKPT